MTEDEQVEWLAKEIRLAVKQMSKYKALTYTAYVVRAKKIIKVLNEN